MEHDHSLPGTVKQHLHAERLEKIDVAQQIPNVVSAASFSSAAGEKSTTSDLIRYLKTHSFHSDEKRSVPVNLKERVREAFQEIDQDGSGFLSRDELRAQVCVALPGSIVKNVLEEAMKHADKNEDGVLDYEEFLEFVLEEKPGFAQRHRLSLDILLIVVFFSIAPVVYCNFGDGDERWNFWDALYFAAVTLTTVGYGDLHPTNDMLRLFTIFYILFGLILVWRILEAAADRLVLYYEEQMVAISREMWERASDTFTPLTKAMTTTMTNSIKTPNTVSRYAAWCRYITACFRPDHLTYRIASKVCALSLLTLVLLAVGTLVISWNEDCSWFLAFYWSVVTITTVGYGDIALEKESSRIFATFYVLAGFAFAGVVIGKLATLKFEMAMYRKNDRLLKRSLSMNMIADMSKDGQVVVDRCAYVCAMLVQMDKVSEADLVPLLQKFDELDMNGDGHLTAEDLQIMRDKRRDVFLQRSPEVSSKTVDEDVGLVNAQSTLSLHSGKAQVEQTDEDSGFVNAKQISENLLS